MKHAILLISGIVITVLFVVFCSQVYELFYYSSGSDFSNELYNSNMYRVIAIITALLTWGIAAVYYYIIDSIRFSRWWHWLVMLGVTSVLTVLITVFYQSRNLLGDYAADIRSFAVACFVMAILMFIIASFSIRWWSKQCRHTPIPQ
jgi:magnesium-transporting ATPase (P-type)